MNNQLIGDSVGGALNGFQLENAPPVGGAGVPNSIINPTTVQNGGAGIAIIGTQGTLISGGNLVLDADVSIWLFNSQTTTIRGVDIDNIGIGVVFEQSYGNLAENNDVHGLGSAFYGVAGIGNTVRTNIVSSDLGFTFDAASHGNLIYNNDISGTWYNAEDLGANIWFVPKSAGPNIIGGPWIGGNAWSDYAGSDVDGDGLGDIPHGPAVGPPLAWTTFGAVDIHPLV